MQQHYEEVPFGNKGRKFEIDVDLYLKLDVENCITVVAAYNDESRTEMYGYIVLLASPSLHHKGEWDVSTDSFYVRPDKRRGGLLRSMLHEAIVHCKDAGMDTIRFGVNANFPDAAKVAKSLGMHEIQTEFAFEF